MRSKEKWLAKRLRIHRGSSLDWASAVIRMMQVFSWLTLFGAFVGSFVFTWFFGTVAVAGAHGIHREVNLMGVAAAGGIFFAGMMIALFLFVVCAAATALVDLLELRREENKEAAQARLGDLTLAQEDRENEPEDFMSNLPGLAQTSTR